MKVSEWDGELAKLVQEQNRSRKIRDKSEGERRKIAHVEYQKKRTTVRRYIRKKERLMKRKQNEELEALKKGCQNVLDEVEELLRTWQEWARATQRIEV